MLGWQGRGLEFVLVGLILNRIVILIITMTNRLKLLPFLILISYKTTIRVQKYIIPFLQVL